MIQIHIDDRQLQEALARLRQRLADLTPVMQDIGEELVARAKQRFATSTGPDGSPPRTRGSTLLEPLHVGLHAVSPAREVGPI